MFGHFFPPLIAGLTCIRIRVTVPVWSDVVHADQSLTTQSRETVKV
jgi:hypothetical protein